MTAPIARAPNVRAVGWLPMGTRPYEGFRWRLDDEGATLFDVGYPERHLGRGEYRGLEFLHVKARTVINPVPACSQMAFRFTINPYRGCTHACSYCFARPTHEYLGLGVGEDFERRIIVKVNAVELAKAELSSPHWRGDLIAMWRSSALTHEATARCSAQPKSRSVP